MLVYAKEVIRLMRRNGEGMSVRHKTRDKTNVGSTKKKGGWTKTKIRITKKGRGISKRRKEEEG